jgi:hypothetical protein
VEKGKSGFIVMGDLPRWRSDLIVISDLCRKRMTRAQRHTRKEVRLENALPKR